MPHEWPSSPATTPQRVPQYVFPATRLPSVITLTGLLRYPIKSTAAETLQQVQADTEGLRHDRRFMLAKPDGRFLTARTRPHLQAICARIHEGELRLSHPQLEPLTIAFDAFGHTEVATAVWKDAFPALSTTPQADAWVSKAAGEPAQLLWLGETSPRWRSKLGQAVSFADAYPLLVIGEASLGDLNARSNGDHVMGQFRPNLVIGGAGAFAEDGWRRIRIGEVVIRLDAGCARCGMIGVDPATAKPRGDKEPLRTLARYRRGEDGQVYFGRNACVEVPGLLRVGDVIEVLETCEPVLA
ncbi:MOSC N-terminal beta barrel domain-containing protein [Oleiagrimonas sp. C23AA]|uniref:MOSC domain-containing protein n=1 Tax=Oleiagrimonas sp. C23AA TaxID=2719047 RepID=UPI00197FD2B1|nr:MOSC N-terminal beta barrel domain-containing protein [Oleiagrimonas sp. C23AA]